jgi:hypothetical protein
MNDPLGFIIATTLLYTFYRLFPRTIRCLFIALGLSLWRSSPASFRDMLEACNTPSSLHFSNSCKGNVSLLGVEIMVYTVAIMCVVEEVETIIRRGRLRDEKTT